MTERKTKQFDGSRIASIRGSKGFTQAELAERIGVTRTYMGLLEIGSKTPSIEVLFSLARVFGCDPGELLPTSAELAHPGRRIFVVSNQPRLTRFTTVEERERVDGQAAAASNRGRAGRGGLRAAGGGDDKSAEGEGERPSAAPGGPPGRRR